MLSLFRAMLGNPGRQVAASSPPRERLHFETMPAAIYAIGDVHGQIALLRLLEEMIARDAARFAGEKWVVLLGDFVDRGPASAQVLDHLTADTPRGLTRLCLAGNHEIMMLDAIEGRCPPRQWLEFGGLETLFSYGISARDLDRAPPSSPRFRYLLDSHIPAEHVQFLRALPVAIDLPKLLLVHAGARLDIPLAQQSDKELTVGLSGISEVPVEDRTIVHGHYIVDMPVSWRGNINVDTGAYLTGRLTAARLIEGIETVFLEASKVHIEAETLPFTEARS